jgi:DNA polymerase-3 subunit epsilon
MTDFDIQQAINDGIDATVLPNGLSMDELQETPETPGVYYLSNVHKRIIYVGKAKNIKKRLFQHFRKLSRKAVNIANQVHHVHHNETGHELIALLLELHEIKTLRPELNKAMKRNHYPFALYHNPIALPEKPRLLITRNNKRNDLKYEKIKLFGSKNGGDSFLQNLIIEYEICSKYARLRSKELLCSCGGACTQFFWDQISYIESLLDGLKNEFDEDLVIITNGRDPLEKGFALLQYGRFRGIGFFPQDEAILSKEKWASYLTHEFFYPEANGIIKTYMNKHKLQTIKL